MKEEFRNYLKTLRLKRGLTISEVSRVSQLCYSTICNIENGKIGFLKPLTLKKFSLAYKEPIEKMLDTYSMFNDRKLKKIQKRKKTKEENLRHNFKLKYSLNNFENFSQEIQYLKCSLIMKDILEKNKKIEFLQSMYTKYLKIVVDNK